MSTCKDAFWNTNPRGKSHQGRQIRGTSSSKHSGERYLEAGVARKTPISPKNSGKTILEDRKITGESIRKNKYHISHTEQIYAWRACREPVPTTLVLRDSSKGNANMQPQSAVACEIQITSSCMMQTVEWGSINCAHEPWKLSGQY